MRPNTLSADFKTRHQQIHTRSKFDSSVISPHVNRSVATFRTIHRSLARIIHEHADQTPRTTGTAGLLVPAGTLQILAS
ncbi:MAG: hypothetical protein ACI87A_000398, partial [Planctomycetota bacterium]